MTSYRRKCCEEKGRLHCPSSTLLGSLSITSGTLENLSCPCLCAGISSEIINPCNSAPAAV
ncbi:rCG63427 [Rattus norvegicus]|uniref:RCG63427 n=1 Tax=Rattus norvegicus TaxID=10116 RepID=A6HU61_RAT|nr:rCG63427 [Rattus norvegicus]